MFEALIASFVHLSKGHISPLKQSHPSFGCRLEVQTIRRESLQSPWKHPANDALNGFDPAPMSQSPVYGG